MKSFDTVELTRSLCNEHCFSPEAANELALKADEPVVKAAILLRAFSVPTEVIEEVLGVEKEELKDVLRIPHLQDFYSRWSVKIKELTSENAHENLLSLAIYVQEKLLSDEQTDPKIRNSIASEVIDRARGKPRQSLDVRSVNLNVETRRDQLEEKVNTALQSLERLKKERETILNAKDAN